MTLSSDWIERHLYDAGEYIGNTYYIRIIQRANSLVWDPDNRILVPEADILWEDEAIVLVDQGQTGVYPIVVPYDIPAGTYDIVVYQQLGSVPQNSDDLEKQYEAKLGGDIFGF